ncbi:MAG TPA: BatD family protein [Thermoanaerobaculia bacterium]|nr:BatD family protein [Thermoanaerobaculia bacterium]
MRAFFLLLFVLSPLPAAAGELRVRATLEPERIGIDETATLSIEVQGGGFTLLRFRPDFELENFEVVGGPYQRDSIQLGSRLAASRRYTWRLRALSTGRARVRGLRIRLGGELIPLGTREAYVQEEPTGLGSPQGREDREDDESAMDRLLGRWEPTWPIRRPRRPDVFLRAEVRPLRPVVGQQVLYTVHLYTLTDITAMAPTSMPDFQGFWVRDIPQPQKLPTDLVELDGKRYGRVVLLQKALFPLRPGRHELQPTEYDFLVRTIERSFFGPPVSHPEQIHLRTAAMPVEVQPLPPSPEGFTGAVGRMSLAARVEPAELRMGEAATVTLTLSGEGNLQGLPEPRLPEVEGLTVLPPQQEGEDKIAGTVVQGSRTWTYAVVPERAGTWRLEVPGVSYFDPANQRYKTATVPPVQLTALPAPASRTVREEPGAAPPPTEDGAPRLEERFPDWRGRLPWLLAVVVPGVGAGVLALAFLLVRRRNGHGTPGPGPAKVTDREARHRLEHALREAGSDNRPRQSAARIEEAWREFLAERWEIPPGTPSPRWGDLLQSRGADPEASRELVRLADDLHYMRYAPQLSTCGTLCGEVLDRSRKLLRKL